MFVFNRRWAPDARFGQLSGFGRALMLAVVSLAATAVFASAANAAVPNTTITTFAPPSAAPTDVVKASFSGTNTPTSFQCRTDANAFATCTSPWTIPISSFTGGAEHTYEVRALNASGTDATPAKGFIWVDNRTFASPVCSATITTECSKVVPTTTQAGAHPNIAATVGVRGAPDAKTVDVTFPQGLNGALSAITTKCTIAQANGGTCPAASKIGTLTGTAEFPSDGTVTATGNLYMTVGPATANAAGVALEMTATGSITGSLGTIRALGAIDLTQTGAPPIVKVKLTVSSVPRQTLAPLNKPFHIRSVTVNLLADPDSNAATYSLITNPFTCPATALNIVGNATSYQGPAISGVNVPYPVTGCSSVAFNPSINQTFTNLNVTQESGTKVTATVPEGNSSLKTVIAKLPSFVGPNYPSFGATTDQCPSTAASSASSLFNPSGCPAQARVGLATLDTQLIRNTGDAAGTHLVKGYVYLINKSPLPWFGIDINPSIAGNPQGITIRLVGTTALPQINPTCDPATDPSGFCQTQISATFANLPDVPLRSMILDLTAAGQGGTRTGGSGTLSPNILSMSGNPCPQPAFGTTPGTDKTSTTFTPQTGTTAQNRQQTFVLAGC